MRTLREIATEAINDWQLARGGCNYAARPYLRAMLELDTLNDAYGADDARSIVLYFLSNATTWRGPVARRIKAELKSMLAGGR
jgi:hypothetical protein